MMNELIKDTKIYVVMAKKRKDDGIIFILY